MNFAGRRLTVDCSGVRRRLVALAEVLATGWWPDECDVSEAETSNEGQFHYRQDVLVAVFAIHQDTGALGDEQGDKTQVYRRKTCASVGVRGWRDRDEDMGG